ncbi:hypothetical protein [Arthrobacter woluwensis]|uniref:Uncharacterized protein n=1 Tax=Arthrobacter woluwensis TaxID=156980 RepID=A0A1H4I6G0_9MICC|nr:hypothetical protein [Arthrobacter woluwensis]SEB28948.1 hypothetical protein SAMN04489745_0026 [Arthrobacter woluwensis]SEC53015.1 hypothetical protein SAMN04489745_3103 [Arthrobacter woluwensis]SEC89494.1 hypothetical protein SAMN04489745_3447 [Arthrobacter woluwensis]SEC96072.1 hypothetical protein SAMN04489745_3557 [Arthrobacter woluwensis]
MNFARAFRWLSNTYWPALLTALILTIYAVMALIRGERETAVYISLTVFWAVFAWQLERKAFGRGYIKGQIDHAEQMKNRKSSRSEVHFTGSPMSVEDFERHVRNSARNRTSNEGL